jgi:hypothetical protein
VQEASEPLVTAPVTVPAPVPAGKPVPKNDPVVASPPPAAPRAQTIEFATEPPAEPVVGGAYSVVAVASSGLPVKLSAAGSRGACKLDGGTVSFRKTGTCVVAAKQPGNDRFAAAEARQEVEIGRAAQDVSFGTVPPSPALVGGTYAAAASASSGLHVALTASGACALRDGLVRLDAPGLCRLQADQAGDERFAPAAASQSFTVALAPVIRLAQSIAFTSAPPSGASWGGAPYTVSAAASSGLPVALSVAPASAGVCSLAGSAVSLLGVGTCTIVASQGGSASWLAAAQVQQSFVVGKAAQSVSFSSSAPSNAVFGGADYVVAAVASSGLPVALGVSGACSLAGSTVSMTGVGTCTVSAGQAGDGSYEAAAQVQQSFMVGKAPQTIAFTSTPPVVDGSVFFYNVAATATSGLAVGFSTPSSGVCAVFGAWVLFYGNGTCLVRADQAGDASWQPAPQATQSILVTGH